MTGVLRLACLSVALSLCGADVYMHNPRGSNNRLNERSANRNNADRLFDSQNNNRGGYNAGDSQTGNTGFTTEDQIYHMKYFQSATAPGGQSLLTVEWTNQHGCGGNEDTDPWKPNCNIVIQVMLQDVTTLDSTNDATRIHDGTNTNTQAYQNPSSTGETYAQYQSRVAQVTVERGLHESFDYYNDCYMRTRNKRLFTADQNLGNNNLGVSSAIFTRQNPNGNRRGYECPEERDYYPYWHPSPWVDIAVLTDNTTFCPYYQSQSFNVQPKGLCRQTFSDNSSIPRPWSVYNNQNDCTTNGGTWWLARSYIDIDVNSVTKSSCQSRNNTLDGYTRYWDMPSFGAAAACLVAPKAPDCQLAPWSRVNHLGNGRSGVPLNYTWTIPYFPSGSTKLAVVRLRYNISTDDYNPWATDSAKNQNAAQKTVSPITQNPYINIGSTTNQPLRLAINTAQFGRTFQDRSHLMELVPRPSALTTCTLYNLNVRGKRGNIVQVYPAVEYDFIPNRLTVLQKDCVHIQWTGSNTHNNGNPAGDGQAGDAGEGLSGTDRSNVVESPNPLANYPTPWDKSTMFKGASVLWVPPDWTKVAANMTPLDVALAYASAGNFQCFSGCSYPANTLTGVYGAIDPLLNTVTPSFQGLVLRFSPGNYYYIGTRNNNFSNRSQKGQLTVK